MAATTGTPAVSDRVYKSKIYPIEALHAARTTPVDQDVNLRTLEIAFDRTCQLACSYCNPAFSTTWVNDIRRYGAYTGLESDGRNHFTHSHDSAQPYRITESNPYIDAFFAWWETDLHHSLQELRITGGEPLMSHYTWRLIDWFRHNPQRSQTRLAINSNLGPQTDIERLIHSVEGMAVEIYTSQESVGTQAEYIRHGQDYDLWLKNVESLLDAGITVHCMNTINAVCLTTLTDHLDQLLAWKKIYGRERINFTLNILRFPSFQSAVILPDDLRLRFRDQLAAWLAHNRDSVLLHEHEINHCVRLIDYLDVVKTPHSNAAELATLRKDFGSFYRQYDSRRGLAFATTFPELAHWYRTLQNGAV
jgi:organic radical activating enzyme